MARRKLIRKATAALIITLALAACTRPDKGPSPFDAIENGAGGKADLPEGPVTAPEFEILPDAELVYGTSTADFAPREEINQLGGRLADYSELVGKKKMAAADILQHVSANYSLNPRLLLVVLDYRSGWALGSDEPISEFPVFSDENAEAVLFRQLSWAANILNYGFYSRRVGGLPSFTTVDNVQILPSEKVSDGTIAVQFLLAQLYGYEEWLLAVGPLGLSARMKKMFPDYAESFAMDARVTVPPQPELVLPFAIGEPWFFTSGPHSAWGSGAAWAALDFAPDEDGFGCYESGARVTAVADGPVVRVDDGVVVQDLDGDGFEGTGWTILYMHIAERNKAAMGTYLNQGDRVGHPSCEGGPATGTHLHIARRYNGEWIPTDQDNPFNLSGWVSAGGGVEYDGTLTQGQNTVEASGFPQNENKITH